MDMYSLGVIYFYMCWYEEEHQENILWYNGDSKINFHGKHDIFCIIKTSVSSFAISEWLFSFLQTRSSTI